MLSVVLLAMAPSSAHPPERHFGYVCCKCQTAAFAGRRYACWMCIGYQLCGSCYDSGQLPEAPEHKYFHPMEAHYTRAEYELYFGGESYVEANVPQSYKCALCDLYGFTSMQLYKHLSDMHRGHKDFDEYFSILYTRYAADASAATGRLTASSSGSGSVSGSGTISRSAIASASAFLRHVPSLPRPVLPVVSQQRAALDPAVSFREAVRMTQARRAALLEQQALNVLEELRWSNTNPRYYSSHCMNVLMRPQEQGQQQQQQGQQQQQQAAHHSQQQPVPPPARPDVSVLDARGMRSPKVSRIRSMPPAVRLGTLFPKPNNQLPRRAAEDDWVSYLAQSSTLLEQQHQQHRAERLLTSYADILREAPGEVRYQEKDKGKDKDKSKTKQGKDKAGADKSDLHKFLCLKFVPLEKTQRKLPPESHRVLFIEALLCSMLADEQLMPVTLQPAAIPKLTNALRKPKPKKEPLDEPSSSANSPAGIMERFYKNLDLYNKWLAEFSITKLENNTKIAAIPDMILQATHDPVLGVDSDMDPDTDERDEEDELTIVGPATKAESGPKVVTVNVVDELSECDAEEEHEEETGEGEGDAEEVEDEDEDDYDDNSGSETSDSTIAMLVNEIDQVYGY